MITPATRFHCPGHLAVYGTIFRCHKEGGHGTLDLKNAIALSCNVYFYNVGIRLEIERLSRYSKLLGLGRPTGIDLPHESSGLFQDPEWKMRTQKVAVVPRGDGFGLHRAGHVPDPGAAGAGGGGGGQRRDGCPGRIS